MGLVLLDSGERLVVYSRFSHSLALIDTGSGDVMAEAAMFTPEPANIIAGRRFLYDARETSANGTSACASCHIFGDMDQLAWDLGNPDGDLLANANPYVSNSPRTTLFFHPMKGPMTTQTLRGIAELSALTIAVEVGDFRRFESAPAFMAFVGLVPSERSSGERRAQGSITKAGKKNCHRFGDKPLHRVPLQPEHQATDFMLIATGVLAKSFGLTRISKSWPPSSRGPGRWILSPETVV